jgi:tRNA threonylcarbamoyl adenosine modification protein YeaZ
MNRNLSVLIDSSTERGIVAIIDDIRILQEIELPFGYESSRALVPSLDTLFKNANISPKQLTYITAGIGPGSYTGIRMGAIVAKTLSYTTQKPLIGITSLAGFIPDQDVRFCAIIDAKISGAYILKGIKENGGVRWISQPQVCPLNELGEKLNDTEVLVTPNAKILQVKVQELYPNANWKWEERAPSAFHLSLLARKQYIDGQYTTDCRLDLLYLRQTQAEIEKNKKHS